MNAEAISSKESRVTWLALFASIGTLVCCALPIVLVTLGLGVTVTVLTSTFPFLITLSLYKIWVFAASGLLLTLSGWLIYRPGRACPIDPELSALCERAHNWNQRIYWTSVVIWIIGFCAAFLALPLRILLGF